MIRPLFESGLSRYVPAILLAALSLGGCTPEEQVHTVAPRPVKVETVSMRPPQGLSLVGTVRAQNRAEMAFETAGVIDQILAQPGQQVSKGTLLAQLDRQPAQLKMAQAKAKLQAQQGLSRQSLQLLERSKRLLVDGTVAQKDVEQAQAQYQSALAEQNIDEAALKLAQREYALTQLRAPFGGRVVSRAVEPHTQITAGQHVLELIATDHQNVVVMIPVEQARGLAVGTEAVGFAEEHRTNALALRLRSLAPEAKGGMLQEAKFEISSPAGDLVDGASIAVQLATANSRAVITLPQQAFRGTPTAGEAEVFVYDPQSKRVMTRAVEVAGLDGARIVVRNGLSEGEQVVTAGSAFLTGRQEVSLFKPASDSSAE